MENEYGYRDSICEWYLEIGNGCLFCPHIWDCCGVDPEEMEEILYLNGFHAPKSTRKERG